MLWTLKKKRKRKKIYILEWNSQTQIRLFFFFTSNQLHFSIHRAKPTYILRIAGTLSKSKSNIRKAGGIIRWMRQWPGKNQSDLVCIFPYAPFLRLWLNLQQLFWLPYSLVSPLVFLLLLKTETRQHPFTKVLCSSNNNGIKKSQLEGESDVHLR